MYVNPRGPRLLGQLAGHPDVVESEQKKRTGKGAKTCAKQSWGYTFKWRLSS